MNQTKNALLNIFNQAAELPDAAERAAFLERACGENAALRQKIEDLLQANEQAGAFLEHPVSPATKETIALSLPPSEQPGDKIGLYKLLEKVGEGGCGVVYVAEQEQPVRRRVALKVIKLGMDTREVIARFEAERQALALMDHPHIAKVLDAGATETGRPFFVMELVKGIPITRYCDENKLNTRQRLNLFIQVCHAIQHAHQKGIIHRDLKPSNILVADHDGVPVPKVIDFGIAKATTDQRLTDKTLYTAIEQFIGTPAYMSPEQAKLSGLDVDTRSDIYSLGVLLYELLTGRTPFDAQELLKEGLDAIRRTIREVEPPRPSTRLSTLQGAALTATAQRHGTESMQLLKLIRGDLDWIVMKCLEKDRTRRYDTANGLAMDLKRHLENEPVVACPPSAGYKLRKAIRRNQGAFVAATAVAGALLIGIGVSTWQATIASRARNREGEANQQLRSQMTETVLARKRADLSAQSEAEQRRRIAGMLEQMQLQKAEDLLSGHEPDLGIDYLVGVLRGNPTNRTAAARLASAVTRPFAVPLAEPMVHESAVNSVEFSSDGLRLLTVSDKAARVWDAHTGKPLTEPLRHEQWIRCARFSPDGLRLVTASDDKTARVWDARTGQPATEPLRHQYPVMSAQFSPDGRRIVTISSGSWMTATVMIWDVGTGQRTIQPLTLVVSLLSAQFCSDGSKILTVSVQHTVSAWDARTGEALSESNKQQGFIANSAELSSDARRLVTSSTSVGFDSADWQVYQSATGVGAKTAQVWDVSTGHSLGEPLRHENSVLSVRFSPDGLRVVTASLDKTARVWDARTGLPLSEPMRHEGAVLDAEFSPDGLRVVTASADETARVWDAQTGLPLSEPIRNSSPVWSARFSPDSSVVATASWDRTVRLWDVRVNNLLTESLTQDDWLTSAEFSPDGSKVVTASGDKTARIWDARTGQPLGKPLRHEAPVTYVQFSPDGSRIVTASEDQTARVWNALTGQPLTDPLRHQDRVEHARFSPDGSKVVTASSDNTARIWDANKGLPITEPLRHEGRVHDAEFSPDGLQVVTASKDKTACVWDARNGRQIAKLLGHEGEVWSAQFSPDGLRVVTASDDKTARVWDARAGRQTGECLGHEGRVWSAQFSSDGLRVVTASGDRTARIWDAQTGQEVGSPLRHEALVHYAQFSPDGLRVATCSDDNTARVWDALTGLPISEPFRHADSVGCVRFSSDGCWMVTASGDHTARVWEVPPVPVPVPNWFLDWAEARSGRRLAASGAVLPISFVDQREQREHVQSRSDTGFFTRIAQWVQSDPSARPISPTASMSVGEYVQRCIEKGSMAKLNEALLLSPTNSQAWVLRTFQFGRQIVESTTRSSGDRRPDRSAAESVALAWHALRAEHPAEDQIEWLLTAAENDAQRAWSLDPNQAEVWQALGIMQWLKNRPTEALASLDRALALQPPDAGETWEIKGDILAQQNRDPEAMEAYHQRIALLPETDTIQGGARCRALDKHAAICRKLGRWSDAVADLRSGGVPAREPAADARLVNLSAFYNLELGGGFEKVLTEIRTCDGTRFDARGCLFLASGKHYSDRVPDQMLGIPMASKGQRIRLLHGTFWGQDAPGTAIGKYVLHFADGTTLERPLVLGRDVLDTHAEPPSPGDGNAKMACALKDANDAAAHPNYLYVTTWDNPHPETEILSLDFISFRQTEAPFLVAVTIE